MNITDIQSCADFFRDNYLNTFYLVITYNGNSFILIGEKSNFPHLMGIQNRTYRSNLLHPIFSHNTSYISSQNHKGKDHLDKSSFLLLPHFHLNQPVFPFCSNTVQILLASLQL